MHAPALLIVDVQKAIDDPGWGNDRNNAFAEERIAILLDHWRSRNWPIFHIRHASREPQSTYRPGQIGFEFKDEVAPLAQERVIEKSTNSAFIGTSLEQELRGITHVVITGVITNNSVEATAYVRQPRLRHDRRIGCNRDVRPPRLQRSVAQGG
jgi:nicotinamidase-related amidase